MLPWGGESEPNIRPRQFVQDVSFMQGKGRSLVRKKRSDPEEGGEGPRYGEGVHLLVMQNATRSCRKVSRTGGRERWGRGWVTISLV